VTAQLDTSALFHDKASGADASLSGLLIMLTVSDLLSGWYHKLTNPPPLRRRIVFAAFGGEPWGYMGSRRFVHDLSSEAPSTAPLRLASLTSVIELGQLGFAEVASEESEAEVYMHVDRQQSGEVNKKLIQSLQEAANGTAAKAELASASNPGVPPASFMSFLTDQMRNTSSHAPLYPGAVLTEFDSQYINPYHWSRYDQASVTLSPRKMAAVAQSVARMLYKEMTGALPPDVSSSGSPSGAVESAVMLKNSTEAFVEELIGCLLRHSPGMQCDMVTDLMTAGSRTAQHYVGIMSSIPSQLQSANDKSDVERFVWNFLGNRTGLLATDPNHKGGGVEAPVACTKQSQCASMGGYCVGITRDSKGWCVRASMNYTLALSKHLTSSHTPNGIKWSVDRNGAVADNDPLITESFWPNDLGSTVFLRDSFQHDLVVFIGGLSVTCVCIVVATVTTVVYDRRLKAA